MRLTSFFIGVGASVGTILMFMVLYHAHKEPRLFLLAALLGGFNYGCMFVIGNLSRDD